MYCSVTSKPRTPIKTSNFKPYFFSDTLIKHVEDNRRELWSSNLNFGKKFGKPKRVRIQNVGPLCMPTKLTDLNSNVYFINGYKYLHIIIPQQTLIVLSEPKKMFLKCKSITIYKLIVYPENQTQKYIKRNSKDPHILWCMWSIKHACRDVIIWWLDAAATPPPSSNLHSSIAPCGGRKGQHTSKVS